MRDQSGAEGVRRRNRRWLEALKREIVAALLVSGATLAERPESYPTIRARPAADGHPVATPDARLQRVSGHGRTGAPSSQMSVSPRGDWPS
jgi:hypothetical protein